MDFAIRQMQESDVDNLAHHFLPLDKPREQFELFWQEHQEGSRVTLVASVAGQAVGYTNLIWQPDHEGFRVAGIPEISTMHVLDSFHRRGIGAALVREAEHVCFAEGKDVIGIGVGLSPDYAAAQQLYARLRYLPDGRGPQETPWGDVLYLTKRLDRPDDKA